MKQAAAASAASTCGGRATANSTGRRQTLEAGLRRKKSSAALKKNYPERQDQHWIYLCEHRLPLDHAISVFITDKQFQGLSDDVSRSTVVSFRA
jgi:hypothetical protein